MDSLYPKCPSSTDPFCAYNAADVALTERLTEKFAGIKDAYKEPPMPPFFVAGAAAMLAGMLLGEFWNRFERLWK